MKALALFTLSVALVLAVAGGAARPAAAAGIPPFCAVQSGEEPVANEQLTALVSGRALTIHCTLRLRADAPHWLVLKTEGDTVTYTLRRLNAAGSVVDVLTYTSPEVAVPADDYELELTMVTPKVVEVLTRPSGLREEVARPTSKALLTVELRTTPSGVPSAQPDIRDLTLRLDTVTDIKAVLVHPFYATAQEELERARAEVGALKSQHGSTWEAAELLDRDLAQAQTALANGQLDRVAELSRMVQRYAAEEAQTVQRVERIDTSRETAMRIAIIAGVIALVTVVGGIGAFGVYHRYTSTALEFEE